MGEGHVRLKIAADRYTEGLLINQFKYFKSQTCKKKRVISYKNIT